MPPDTDLAEIELNSELIASSEEICIHVACGLIHDRFLKGLESCFF